MQIENVSLIEVIAAARGRHASLVVESTGYLMLGIVRAMGGRPVRVDARRAMLNTEGVVTLTGQRRVAPADAVAAELHRLLRCLLEASQGVGTALRSIAAAPPTSFETLFTGVAKSLIPINRSAAKRALGRLARETVRARNRGQLSTDDVDAAIARLDQEEPEQPLQPAPEAPREEESAPGRATPTPSVPVEDVMSAPEGWGDIDANIDLATSVPAPAIQIELATPTPAPVAAATEALEDEPFEVDCSLDDLEESEEPPVAVPSAPQRDEDRVARADDDTEDDAEAEAPEADDGEEEERPQPFSVEGSEAPFVRVTPAPAMVDVSPSPTSVTSGTPTIVDATLYGLTGRATEIDVEEGEESSRISVMSVQLPPAEPMPVIAPVEIVDVEAAEELGGEEPEVDDDGAVEAGDPIDDDEEEPEAPRSAIEEEAELAERLLARVQAQASKPKPGSVEALLESFGASPEGDAVTEAAASLKRMMNLDVTPHPPRITSASGAFTIELAPEADDDEAPPSEPEVAPPARAVRLPEPPVADVEPEPIQEAEAAEAAPVPLLRKQEDDELEEPTMEDPTMDTPSSPHLYEDAVPSVSPPPVRVADADGDVSRFTPTELRRGKSPAAQRALFIGTTMLLAGVFVMGFLYWQHPHTLGLQRDGASAPAIGGGAAPAGPCYVDLTLKDLPSPHEVLLQLGQAPFTSRPLPTGVTLELIGLAPGHQPKRVIVPADAEWIDGPDGKTMALPIELRPGVTNTWPDAPAGEVGGVGPEGTIDFTAKPADAEVWLVASAGEGERAPVTVPCGATAHLLVLNPREPTKRRRLSVEPNMLEAARHAGGAELSVQP
jgi:hypothetical protein